MEKYEHVGEEERWRKWTDTVERETWNTKGSKRDQRWGRVQVKQWNIKYRQGKYNSQKSGARFWQRSVRCQADWTGFFNLSRGRLRESAKNTWSCLKIIDSPCSLCLCTCCDLSGISYFVIEISMAVRNGSEVRNSFAAVTIWYKSFIISTKCHTCIFLKPM